MSNKLDLELKQGEDFFRLVTIKDENGYPIDLSGYSFNGQAKESFVSATYIFFTFLIRDQVTNKGEVEFSIARSQTSKKKIRERKPLIYDVEMNSGSQVSRILQGSMVLDPGVTK